LSLSSNRNTAHEKLNPFAVDNGPTTSKNGVTCAPVSVNVPSASRSDDKDAFVDGRLDAYGTPYAIALDDDEKMDVKHALRTKATT
jgi:hypothetical protein